MSPNTCCYQGCYTQRYFCASITFFQLPTDEPRRTQWILNSGNKQLRSLKSSQKRYFCEKHFKKQDIKSHCYRKILHKNAVPEPYGGVELTTNMVREPDYIEYEVVEVEFQHAEVTSSDNTYEVDGISEDNDDTEIEENVLLSPNQSCVHLGIDSEEEMEETICTEDASSATDVSLSQTDLIPIKNTRCDLSVRPISETITAYIDCEATSSPKMDAKISNPTNSSDKDNVRNVEETSRQKLEMNKDNEINCDINIISDESNDIPDESNLQSVKHPQSSNSGENCLSNIKHLQEQRQQQSYESDKHFALSLVYYFQRLNAKKNVKAKSDILSYLMSLEQDDDAQLGSDKLERKAN